MTENQKRVERIPAQLPSHLTFDPRQALQKDITTIKGVEFISLMLNSNDYVLLTVDCRYPYEYAGGHFVGAHNFYRFNDFKQYMSTVKIPGDKLVIVFYCEFTSHRALKMFNDFRGYDRLTNGERIRYPYCFKLKGGFSGFWEKYSGFPHFFSPDAQYVPMADPRFTRECQFYHSQFRNSYQNRTGLHLQVLSDDQNTQDNQENHQSGDLPSEDGSPSSPPKRRHSSQGRHHHDHGTHAPKTALSTPTPVRSTAHYANSLSPLLDLPSAVASLPELDEPPTPEACQSVTSSPHVRHSTDTPPPMLGDAVSEQSFLHLNPVNPFSEFAHFSPNTSCSSFEDISSLLSSFQTESLISTSSYPSSTEPTPSKDQSDTSPKSNDPATSVAKPAENTTTPTKPRDSTPPPKHAKEPATHSIKPKDPTVHSTKSKGSTPSSSKTSMDPQHSPKSNGDSMSNSKKAKDRSTHPPKSDRRPPS